MKSSKLFRLAAELLVEIAERDRSQGACIALANAYFCSNTLYTEYTTTSELFSSLYWQPGPPYWFGPLCEENVNARVLALLFAAEIAKDEENGK
jgi:hypothetical protein